jgi:hypothetical protein
MQVERLLSSSPTGNVHAWRAFHIQPGVPAIFRLSVTSTDDAAGRAALARATLQLGVFEIPRHPARSRGVWIERHIVDPAAARGAFVLVHRKFTRIGPGRHALTVPVPADGQQIYVRTFVVRGEGSGITLKPGPRTHNELQSAVGPWSVEKSIDSGPSTVRVALATVPRGVERRVGMLVYVRYE